MKVVLVETIPTVNPVPYSYTPYAIRSGGWHMKAVLQAIGEQAGLLDPWERPASGWSETSGSEGDGVGVACTWAAPLWPLMGLAWEAMILPATAPNGHPIPEQSYEFDCGETVYFSPDWATKLTAWPDHNGDMVHLKGKMVPCLDECKCTWRSANKSIADWWLAITQLKSYCMAMGVFRGRLTVVYVNGHYEKNVVGVPVLKRHWIEFTRADFDMQEELINGWLQERATLRKAFHKHRQQQVIQG